MSAHWNGWSAFRTKVQERLHQEAFYEWRVIPEQSDPYTYPK